jgi:hypothetical protein
MIENAGSSVIDATVMRPWNVNMTHRLNVVVNAAAINDAIEVVIFIDVDVLQHVRVRAL